MPRCDSCGAPAIFTTAGGHVCAQCLQQQSPKLAQGQVARCTGCGRPIAAAGNGPALCSACRAPQPTQTPARAFDCFKEPVHVTRETRVVCPASPVDLDHTETCVLCKGTGYVEAIDDT